MAGKNATKFQPFDSRTSPPKKPLKGAGSSPKKRSPEGWASAASETGPHHYSKAKHFLGRRRVTFIHLPAQRFAGSFGRYEPGSGAQCSFALYRPDRFQRSGIFPLVSCTGELKKCFRRNSCPPLQQHCSGVWRRDRCISGNGRTVPLTYQKKDGAEKRMERFPGFPLQRDTHNSTKGLPWFPSVSLRRQRNGVHRFLRARHGAPSKGCLSVLLRQPSL